MISNHLEGASVCIGKRDTDTAGKAFRISMLTEPFIITILPLVELLPPSGAPKITTAINLNESRREPIMTIEKKLNGTELTIALAGHLDTVTAPQLEAELKDSLNGVESLRLDFASLDYISSAGLRVLLAAQKTMNKQGRMVLSHVNETIAEIFDVTGFSDILTVE